MTQDLPSLESEQSDPFKWHAIAVAVLFVVTLPAVLGAIIVTLPEAAVDPWAEAAEELGVSPSTLAIGEGTYRTACALCHGPNADGIPRLGKPLRNSEFVQTRTDDELFMLTVNGRLPDDPENTSGTLMPPRGAQALDDERLHAVVYYLRTLQNPNAPAVSGDTWIVEKAPVDPEVAVAIAASSNLPGRDVFIAACSVCHGEIGQGIDGLGKPFNDSKFVASKSDKELMTFVKVGRPIWDPDNTTGVDMPPKGGNPALSDEDLEQIIKYIRALQE